ncbi:hypothetical protein [Legionella fallonii]|uniref:Uncharacterized protein n=1 Tax=Legionella fallonii LLAP-10 TaxID=1212491 RepID=A0A098G316_9GAMM|nr:hypothetical protein [Legionella fallonii]CEG56381.1 conserved exported protein of unknown function [Legionella fallonii LLAP-10]
MLRKIGFTLLCAAASISAPCYSMATHALRPGVTLEYDLPPHQPQLFVNYMFWSVEANCKIAMEDEAVDLFAEALAKKGKINDIPILAGDTRLLHVLAGDTLKLAADSGAKVQITNQSDRMVHATCTS